MKCVITINMDKESFNDGEQGGAELASILREYASKTEKGIGIGGTDTLYDSQGAVVGKARISGKRR